MEIAAASDAQVVAVLEVEVAVVPDRVVLEVQAVAVLGRSGM